MRRGERDENQKARTQNPEPRTRTGRDQSSKGFQKVITATQSVCNWSKAMEFYRRALGATELYRVPGGGTGPPTSIAGGWDGSLIGSSITGKLAGR